MNSPHHGPHGVRGAMLKGMLDRSKYWTRRIRVWNVICINLEQVANYNCTVNEIMPISWVPPLVAILVHRHSLGQLAFEVPFKHNHGD